MANAIAVKFVDNADSADDGMIVIDITTSETSATTHTVAITGPAGSFKTAGSPDATGTNVQVKVAIPTDVDGDYLPGDYTFTIVITPNGDGSPVELEETYTYGALSTAKVMDVTVYADCITKQLVIRDDTTYPTGFTESVSFTVDTPVIAGEADVADTEYTTSPTTISLTRSSGVAYENVTYSVTYYATISKETTQNSYTFEEEYLYPSRSTEYKVRCNLDLCNILNCANEYIEDALADACKRGGISSLPKAKLDELQELSIYMDQYSWYSHPNCYNGEKATYYYDKIKAIVEQCGCTETTGARAISTSTTVYLEGKSAYDLWLEAGNSGTLQDFLDSLYPIDDWQIIQTTDLESEAQSKSITLNSSGALTFGIRATRAEIHIAGRIGFPGAGIAGADTIDFLDIPDFLGYDITPVTTQEHPIHNAAGDVVAILSINTSGLATIAIYSGKTAAGSCYVNMSLFVNPISSVSVTPEFTDWVTISDEELTGYDSGDPGSSIFQAVGGYTNLQWRTDGKWVFFRGNIRPYANSTSGLEMIPASYFTSRGITLMTGSRLTVVDGTTGSNDPLPFIGSLVAQSDNSIDMVAGSNALGGPRTFIGAMRRSA